MVSMAKQIQSDPALTQLFQELVAIPSPSAKELAFAEHLQSWLRERGIDAVFDESASVTGSNCGNLIATVKGTTDQTLLFVGHMDTVETGERAIVSEVKNGKIVSDGKTILGSDNKSAVTAILSALVEVSTWPERPTVIGAFTTHEERGTMGASALGLPDSVDFGFNVDGSKPVGTIISQTLGETPFTVSVIGKESHAAHAPEDGRHAIKAAAQFVEALPLGRGEQGQTMNIGVINGGHATNVIPGNVQMRGEARAFTEPELQKQLAIVTDTAARIADETECQIIIETFPEQGMPPFFQSQDSPIIKLVKQATTDIGITPIIESGSFSTEVNVLAERGFPVVNLTSGGRNPHAVSEMIDELELAQLKAQILSIVRSATTKK
jgi:tripeptide aminopeptidase